LLRLAARLARPVKNYEIKPILRERMKDGCGITNCGNPDFAMDKKRMEGFRSGKGALDQASPARSAMAIARRMTDTAIPALDNSQIAEILDADDFHA
jgi:hypothetical protein